jgi:hypothetical protein
MITKDQVDAAYINWRQANDVAQAMSRAGIPQDQLDQLWVVEEEMLIEYTVIYTEFEDQKESKQ